MPQPFYNFICFVDCCFLRSCRFSYDFLLNWCAWSVSVRTALIVNGRAYVQRTVLYMHCTLWAFGGSALQYHWRLIQLIYWIHSLTLFSILSNTKKGALAVNKLITVIMDFFASACFYFFFNVKTPTKHKEMQLLRWCSSLATNIPPSAFSFIIKKLLRPLPAGFVVCSSPRNLWCTFLGQKIGKHGEITEQRRAIEQ
jgi:hypothetical protein